MEPRPMILDDNPEIMPGGEDDVGEETETVEQFFAKSQGNTLYFSYATTHAKITIGISHDNATLEEMVKAAKELINEFRKKKD
ncbi:hypothetical protein E3E31_11500 [Thermococcus sp. M39]|uniref:hypothetical protein n=1 Tax=unclassified Thermococcus TaxID=2627626 RepID=UPI00143BBD1C|nr:MULTISPECIES: hypothetical protein [unclassified Thermococcus]NJE09138.1 hypothetical protein [Thermococcus sp. M39]NJE12087.1 hypothetical protein [Thermococcus sp. LS2]